MFPSNLLPVLLAMHGYVYALLEVKSHMYFLWMSPDSLSLSPPPLPPPPFPPPRQAENKASQLHMSPDVSDKVRAGFFCWFDVHFKQPTSQLCCWFAMEILLLFFFFSWYFALEAKQNVKWVTSLFSCNDFYKLLVCCVLFLCWFDLVADEHTLRFSPLALSGVSDAAFLLLITVH